MTALERRASVSLALIFALRMLGLFLVLPVFALEARKYPGGDDPALVGLAMGMYGLTQAVFQLPLGMASDRWGRKRVIVAGLLVFAAGSLIAALADTLTGVLAGRALQGAGAVSAAVTALLADQTRDGVRTKAMALVGGSIGLMFAIALVAAPALAARIGLAGLFGLTCALALAGVAVVLWWVPPEPAQHAQATKAAGRPWLQNRKHDAARDHRRCRRLPARVAALRLPRGRRRTGVDIFKAGSGNPGAPNVKRVLGAKAGNIVFVLDALKGTVATGWPLLAVLDGA